MSNSRIIGEVKQILSIGPKNQLGLTYSEFVDIQDTLKDHPYYDEDWDESYTDFYNVEEFVKCCEPHEWSQLKVAAEGIGADIFDDLEIKTLADIQRAELLIKLYNSTSSIAELEGMLKKKFRNERF